jgi:hypothetical protein
MRVKYAIVGVLLGVLLSSAVIVLAGSREPPAGPGDAASQMYTLEQIYDRLDGGAATAKMTTFTEPSSGPGSGTMRTLDEIMAKIPAARPDPPCFANDHRYVNCGNGTVHDTVTNLLWLRDGNCFLVEMHWTDANNAVLGLEDGECGLTDGSSPGDWRLPTKEEWEVTVERAVALNCTYQNAPSLVNKPGTKCTNVEWPAFNNIQTAKYWSSMTHPEFPFSAYYVTLYSGDVSGNFKTDTAYVWPVRDTK